MGEGGLGQGGRLVDACNRAGIHGGVMERSVRGNVSMHKLWRRGSTQEHTAGRFTFSLHDHTMISVNALTEKNASNISCPERTNRFSSCQLKGFHYKHAFTTTFQIGNSRVFIGISAWT